MNIRNNTLALLAAAAMTACSSHTEGHDHDHDHEDHDHDEKVLVTAYSPQYELYAEATPLVVGEESEMLIHLTSLPSFKPLHSAKVTVRLSQAGKVKSIAAEPSATPGIYHADFDPEAVGLASLSLIINDADTISAGQLTVYPDHHQAHHAAEEAMPHSSNAVTFTKEMSWKCDFNTAAAKAIPLGQTIRVMAQVLPSQGDIRAISAPAAGVISYIRPTLTDGSNVKAGETLFNIEAAELSDDNLRVRMQQAKSEYESAQAIYKRTSELYAEQLATEQQLIESRTAFESARASYDNLRSGLEGSNCRVSSPLTGYVTQLAISNGQYVEAGQSLATVAQNRELLVKAELQPSLYRLLPHINNAYIRCGEDSRLMSLDELNGSVVSYGKSVDAQNPLLPVVFRIDNTPTLLPGSFVEMTIDAGPQTPVTAIPAQAIVEEMGNQFVYVQLTPELFEKRQVKTGRSNGRFIQVTDGIEPGERVVANGAILVKLAHSSGSLDAHSGHVH